MPPSRFALWIVVGSCALLSAGCIPFPRHTTLQPKTHFVVRDSNQQPLAGATITVITFSYPHRREEFRTTKVTDSSGIADFEALQEWQKSYPLMIHGVVIYSWDWQAEKAGYVPVSQKLTSEEVEVTMQVVSTRQ